MLRVERLAKSYGEGAYALADLSFSVPPGSITTLLGHNGAGKSTTLRILAGTVAPSSGSVTILGVRHERGSPDFDIALRRRIGFLPETSSLLPFMTPCEFLRHVGQLYGIDDAVLASRLASVGPTFGFQDDDRRLIRELSAGQRRRLAICSAVLNEPDLLLLDEPTNSLDPGGVKTLKAFLGSARSEGRAVVLASHRLDVAEELSDRIVVIDHGRAVCSCCPF